MENFEVDGILCEVVNPLCDYRVVTEANEIYQITACYKGHTLYMSYDKDDPEEQVRGSVTFGLREAFRRIDGE